MNNRGASTKNIFSPIKLSKVYYLKINYLSKNCALSKLIGTLFLDTPKIDNIYLRTYTYEAMALSIMLSLKEWSCHYVVFVVQ